MAVYRGEKYLARQIDSILPQLSDADELIISTQINDASCDAILSQYQTDSRVKCVQSAANAVPLILTSRSARFCWIRKADL